MTQLNLASLLTKAVKPVIDPLLEERLKNIRNTPSVGSRVLGTVLGGVQLVGNVLDTPGAVVRTTIDALQGDRPYTDILRSIFDTKARASGEDVLNKKDSFWAGLGVEIALDPFLFFSVGTKTAAKVIGKKLPDLIARKTVLKAGIRSAVAGSGEKTRLILEYISTTRRVQELSREYARLGGSEAVQRSIISFDPLFRKKLFGLNQPVSIIENATANRIIASPFKLIGKGLGAVPGSSSAKKMVAQAFKTGLGDPVLDNIQRITRGRMRAGGLDIQVTAQGLNKSFEDLAKVLIEEGIIKEPEQLAKFFIQASELRGLSDKVQDQIGTLIGEMQKAGILDSSITSQKEALEIIQNSLVDAPLKVEELKATSEAILEVHVRRQKARLKFDKNPDDIANNIEMGVIESQLDQLIAPIFRRIGSSKETKEVINAYMKKGEISGILEHLQDLIKVEKKSLKFAKKVRSLEDFVIASGRKYEAIPQVIKDFAEKFGDTLAPEFQAAVAKGIPFAPRDSFLGYLHRATTPEAMLLLEDKEILKLLNAKFFSRFRAFQKASRNKVVGIQEARTLDDKFLLDINEFFRELTGKNIEFFTTDPVQIYVHYSKLLARAEAKTNVISLWTQLNLIKGKTKGDKGVITLAKFLSGDKQTAPKLLRWGLAEWEYNATTKQIAEALKKAGYDKLYISKEGLPQLDALLDASLGKFEKIAPVIRLYDQMMSLWRGSLITLFPAYTARNIMTNASMIAMAGGVEINHVQKAKIIVDAGLDMLQNKGTVARIEILKGNIVSLYKNEKGEVMTWYHGTTADFAAFSDKQIASNMPFSPTSKQGFFFTTNPQTAASKYYTSKNIVSDVDVKRLNEIEDELKRLHNSISPTDGILIETYFSTKGLLEKDLGEFYHLKSLGEDTTEVLKRIDENKQFLSSQEFDHIRPQLDTIETLKLESEIIERNGANIRQVALKLENPKTLDMGYEAYDSNIWKEHIEQAKREGYDSVIFKNTLDSETLDAADIVIVFKADQVVPYFPTEFAKPTYKVVRQEAEGLSKEAQLFKEMYELGVFGTSRSRLFETMSNRSLGETGVISSLFTDPLNALSRGMVPEKVSRFAPLGYYGNQNIENVSRAALYIARREQGWAPVEALAEVNKYLFDYGDLTAFEQKFLRRNMLFYTFTRKNIPLMMNSVVDHPKFLVNYARVTRQTSSGETGRPSWLPDSVHLANVRGKELVAAFGLPFEDLNKFDPQGKGLSRPLEVLLNESNPLFKGIVQGATGRDLFRGQPLEGGLLSRLAKLSPASRAIGTIQSLVEPPRSMNRAAKALQFMTGIAIRTVDPQQAEMSKDMESVLQRLDTMWRAGKVRKTEDFTYRYSTEGERLSEDEAQLMFKLKNKIRQQMRDYHETK